MLLYGVMLLWGSAVLCSCSFWGALQGAVSIAVGMLPHRGRVGGAGRGDVGQKDAGMGGVGTEDGGSWGHGGEGCGDVGQGAKGAGSQEARM